MILTELYGNLTEGSRVAAEERDYAKSLLHLHAALRLSRKLQSEPSVVAPLFTPLEHELAVYLPLWAPLALPLLVGLLKEAKRYRRKKTAKVRRKTQG